MTPTALERVYAWGMKRINARRWEQDDTEWVFALRWCRWSFLLELRGCPGEDLRECSPGLWYRDETGRQLLHTVAESLRRDGLVALEGWRAWPIDNPSLKRALEGLWRWLDRETPAGLPFGRTWPQAQF
jgi:hypothetical protein